MAYLYHIENINTESSEYGFKYIGFRKNNTYSEDSIADLKKYRTSSSVKKFRDELLEFPNNFKWTILEESPDWKAVCDKEKAVLREIKKEDRCKYYNKSFDCTSNYKIFEQSGIKSPSYGKSSFCSEETKKKRSNSLQKRVKLGLNVGRPKGIPATKEQGERRQKTRAIKRVVNVLNKIVLNKLEIPFIDFTWKQNEESKNRRSIARKGYKQSKETKEKIGRANAIANKGKCWIKRGEESFQIPKDKLEEYILLGFSVGRKSYGKGATLWITNYTESKMIKIEDYLEYEKLGYTKGRHSRSSLKDSKDSKEKRK